MELVNPQDLFDLLPEDLVLVIFNKVQDVKALCKCMCVCTRFKLLVPQSDTLRLTIPPPFPHPSKTPMNFFSKLLFKLNPLRLFRNPSKNADSVLHPIPLLKSFDEIRSLVLELPSQEGDISSINNSYMLKWRAEVGRQLESCVILGATSFHKSSHYGTNHELEEKSDDRVRMLDVRNDILKSRIVWTISCLIAASARHRMIKDIISKHQSIQNVEITDRCNQGRVIMREPIIEESKCCDGMESESEIFPALTMTIWYMPVLEMPESGCTMKGATLTVIRALGMEYCDIDLAMSAFGDVKDEDKCFDEAVKKLISNKAVYTIEMNAL